MTTHTFLPETSGLREPTLRARYWYLLTITGAIGVVVGVLVLSKPDRSLTALAVIAGVYLLLIGGLLIARTVTDESRAPGGMLLGIIAIIAGVVVIRHPGESIVAISMALGIYFLVAGAIALARAIVGPNRLIALARGVVFVAAGVIITSSPEISVKTLALITGISLCLQGAIEIGEGFAVRSLYRKAA